ncbi:MAG TPA: J domain-containing protein [Blastocatellia bacterium]|nr:J domain-containing protein [Blastocatellia bacterium]
MERTKVEKVEGAQAAGVIAEVYRILACIDQGADHYGVLGLNRDAQIEEIRKAYCAAVESLHPLKRREIAESHGTMHWKMSQAFLRVVEAFSTLSRPARRIEYDATLNRKKSIPLPLPNLPEPYQPGNGSEISRRLTAAEAPAAKPAIGSAYGNAQTNIPRVRDRRRAIRYALHLPLRVTSARCDWQEVTETHNVSQSGVRFGISRAVEPGTLLHLELPMPPGLRPSGQMDKMYVVKAVVRHATPDGQLNTTVGAEFVYESSEPSEPPDADAAASGDACETVERGGPTPDN